MLNVRAKATVDAKPPNPKDPLPGLRATYDRTVRDTLVRSQEIRDRFIGSGDLEDTRSERDFRYRNSKSGSYRRRTDDDVGTWPLVRVQPDFGFLWIGGGFDPEAWRFAIYQVHAWLIQRAPVDSGRYVRAVGLWRNGKRVSLGVVQRVTLAETDVILIGADPVTRKGFGYANRVELGYYERQYQATGGLDGGIIRPLAARARRLPGVTARFGYSAVQDSGTFPAIRIAPDTVILPRDARPGEATEAKLRRAAATNRRG